MGDGGVVGAGVGVVVCAALLLRLLRCVLLLLLLLHLRLILPREPGILWRRRSVIGIRIRVQRGLIRVGDVRWWSNWSYLLLLGTLWTCGRGGGSGGGGRGGGGALAPEEEED